jgi:hypothetical protein
MQAGSKLGALRFAENAYELATLVPDRRGFDQH